MRKLREPRKYGKSDVVGAIQALSFNLNMSALGQNAIRMENVLPSIS